MRLNNTEVNNLAIYTGVKTDALSRFIRKYNLNVTKLEKDVMKYKRIRLDLAAAISGYDNNDLAQDIARKYSLEESRRATEFFESKHGKAIFNLLKRNGKVFNREMVQQYFDKLNTNDLKWSRIMDFIASDLGLNYAIYSTFEEQERDMLDAIEKLYNQYQTSDTKLIISKNAINEMVEKAVQPDIEIDQERKKMKRIVIDVVQFEALLNYLLNPINKSVAINEGALEDTYTFEVYSPRMKRFLDFIQGIPTITTTKLKKDGHYVYLTLTNSGRFEEWEPVVKYYKEHIKI
jgi:hypothetical protein